MQIKLEKIKERPSLLFTVKKKDDKYFLQLNEWTEKIYFLSDAEIKHRRMDCFCREASYPSIREKFFSIEIKKSDALGYIQNIRKIVQGSHVQKKTVCVRELDAHFNNFGGLVTLNINNKSEIVLKRIYNKRKAGCNFKLSGLLLGRKKTDSLFVWKKIFKLTHLYLKKNEHTNKLNKFKLLGDSNRELSIFEGFMDTLIVQSKD